MTRPRPAVFIDRDDTLIANASLPDRAWSSLPAGANRGDLLDPERVELLPGVLEGCRRLRSAGYALVVVTNQGGVARTGDPRTLARMAAVNDRLGDLLADDRGRPLLHAVYACPFHPDAAHPWLGVEHPWRKPGGGMITAAAAELGLSLESSWLMGDAERDIDAGIAAGLDPNRCLLVPAGGFADAADRVLCVAADDGVKPESQTDAEAHTPAGVHLGNEAVAVAITSQVRVVPATRVELRARGKPLGNPATRSTVEATARAIAERTGIGIVALDSTDSSVEVTIATHRLGAVGFMSELRRLTNAWHEGKHGTPLWTA